ncbi:glycine cleavage system protein GcvH [candidate division WOR-3 bacterium]|nr:glycine cleavage system protein GcvH [candidate division WOR-3 bacterium]
MNIPKELKYRKTHEWVKIDGDTAIQGITDFAQSELSDIAFIELPQIEDKVKAGESCGTIEAVKAVSDLYAALSGEIVETNDKLGSNPEMINESPYTDGWFFKIKISDASEIDNLMNAEDYEKFLAEEH